jgi:hypothetical protein
MPDKKPQTRENHARTEPLFHYFFSGAVLILLIYGISELIKHPGIESGMRLLLIIAVAIAGWLSRTNALKVQDRLIRLEERLRLVTILPAERHSRIDLLTERQLIALRFASDGELPDLVEQTLTDKLEPKGIKERIRSWRPDYWRV